MSRDAEYIIMNSIFGVFYNSRLFADIYTNCKTNVIDTFLCGTD